MSIWSHFEGQVYSEGLLFAPRAPMGRSWRVLKSRDFQARKWDSWGHSSYGMSPSGSQVSNNPGSWCGLYGLVVLLRVGELGLSLLAPAGEMSRLSQVAWQHVCALLAPRTEPLPGCSWLRVQRKPPTSTGLLGCHILLVSLSILHGPLLRLCPQSLS